MADAWGSLPDLINRLDALDEDAADLSEDVVTTLGDDEETVRVCGDVRASISVLAALLHESAAVRGDQP